MGCQQAVNYCKQCRRWPWQRLTEVFGPLCLLPHVVYPQLSPAREGRWQSKGKEASSSEASLPSARESRTRDGFRRHQG